MSSVRLQQRRDLFWLSPAVAQLAEGERDALRGRLLEAATYAGLSDADRELLRGGVVDVSATGVADLGFGPTGDWSAIDEALDAGDEAALEAALDTVGPVEFGYGPAPLPDVDVPGVEPDDDDEEYGGPVDDDGFPVDIDDDGWVGL